MIFNTEVIVLSTIKYGDSSLIAKCYTLELGFQTFMLKGILAKKKGKVVKSHFLPLSIVQIQGKQLTKGSLSHVSEAQITYPLQTIHTDYVKQTIVYFITEFLSVVLAEEQEANQELFAYLRSIIVWLDTHDEVANFHLMCMLQLSKFLGFYPDEENIQSATGFHMVEGSFTQLPDQFCMVGPVLESFKQLLYFNNQSINQLLLNKNQRNELLQWLLKYYQYHLNTFKSPKTLAVLVQLITA